MPLNMTCACPAITSVKACAPPLYGTYSHSMPARLANGQMRRATGTGGRGAVTANRHFRCSDEFGQRFRGHRPIDHREVRRVGDHGDRGEVFANVKRQFRAERGCAGEATDVGEQERRAIGCRLGNEIAAERAVGSR